MSTQLMRFSLLFAVVVFGLLVLAAPVRAYEVNVNAILDSSNLNSTENDINLSSNMGIVGLSSQSGMKILSENEDIRVRKISVFLRRRQSPLSLYAKHFVTQADKYNLDYRLLVAISGVESTFGRNYIPQTYNVWGWGVGKIPFLSFEDGISKISRGLRENYLNRGALTIEQIGYIYCPPTYLSWSGKVQYFMAEIENTEIAEKPVTLASSLPLSL